MTVLGPLFRSEVRRINLARRLRPRATQDGALMQSRARSDHAGHDRANTSNSSTPPQAVRTTLCVSVRGLGFEKRQPSIETSLGWPLDERNPGFRELHGLEESYLLIELLNVMRLHLVNILQPCSNLSSFFLILLLTQQNSASTNHESSSADPKSCGK